MNNFSMSLIVIAFCITIFTSDAQGMNSYLGEENNNEYGLVKRAYTITGNSGLTGGGKRIPNYNFGLGKRAIPYSFGLGKRGGYEDEYSDLSGSYDEAFAQNSAGGRPYSFGLGKRNALDYDLLQRRSVHPAYNFGLGRR